MSSTSTPDVAATPEDVFSTKLHSNIELLTKLASALPEKDDYYFRADTSVDFKVFFYIGHN
jgi:hypothetical protein